MSLSLAGTPVSRAAAHRGKETGHNPIVRPPCLLKTVGTYGNLVARYVREDLLRLYGEHPLHLPILSVDTTGQPRNGGVPTLPDSCFVNWAETPQIQPRLRSAPYNPAYAWLEKDVANMAIGRGSGARPCVARFVLEASLPVYIAKQGDVLRRFQGAERARTAAAANQLPRLRKHDMLVAASGPIDVIYAVSLTGGSAGVLAYDVVLTRHQLNNMGIEAAFTLVLIPPAVNGLASVDAQSKLNLAYGRLQELSDLQNGAPFRWDIHEGREIRDQGPIFETIVLTREVNPAALDRNARDVAQLLVEFTHPLGKTFYDKAIDMHEPSRKRGPLGQRKSFSAVGAAKLRAAAFSRPEEFARCLLGIATTRPAEVAAGSRAAELLEANGFTLVAMTARRPQLETPPIPPGIGPQNAGAYLENVGRKFESDAVRAVQQAIEPIHRLCDQLEAAWVQAMERVFIEAGPRAAAQFVGAVRLQLETLKTAVRRCANDVTPTVGSSATEAIRDRLAAAKGRQEEKARADYWNRVDERLQETLRQTESREAALKEGVEAFDDLRIVYSQQAEDYTPSQAEPYAFLDLAALSDLISRAAEGCTQAARRVAVELIRGAADKARLVSAIVAEVDRWAAEFAPLGELNAACKAAGERAIPAFANFLAAAEPACRLDASWDSNRHAHRYLFVTLPPAHALASLCERSCRVVQYVPGVSQDEIVAVAADFTIEPGAFSMTEEALRAYLESRTSPFADQHYRPLTDLVVPMPDERLAVMAIPLHLELGTGLIRKDDFRGWFYGDVRLGKTRREASASLRNKQHRLAGLPSFGELTERIEALLLGRTQPEVFALLRSMDEKLCRHVELSKDGGEIFVLKQELAAVRAVLAEYYRETQAAENDRLVWGGANGSADSPPETSPDEGGEEPPDSEEERAA